jgi:hypothetical protein
MEQTTQVKTYYTLTDASKATGKDKRTLKRYREEGQLSAEPIMEGERIAGWKFDPAELARVFPDTFRLLEQVENDEPTVNGLKDPAQPAPKGAVHDDVIRSYQEQTRAYLSQIHLLQESLVTSQESEKQARREAREERESIRAERAGLHKIIETNSQSMRLLTDERQRPPTPVTPPMFTRAHYAYFAAVLTLIAAGLLYSSFFKT